MGAQSSDEIIESIARVHRQYLREKSPLTFVGWLIKSAIDSDPEFLAKAANLAAREEENK